MRTYSLTFVGSPSYVSHSGMATAHMRMVLPQGVTHQPRDMAGFFANLIIGTESLEIGYTPRNYDDYDMDVPGAGSVNYLRETVEAIEENQQLFVYEVSTPAFHQDDESGSFVQGPDRIYGAVVVREV